MPSRNREHSEPPSVCPNCGADVPRKALACLECGADYDTGWKEYAADADWGSPEDSFDYDDAFKKEFGREIVPTHVRPIWWITGVVLLILFAVGLLRALL